jgi:hypothetical protein
MKRKCVTVDIDNTPVRIQINKGKKVSEKMIEDARKLMKAIKEGKFIGKNIGF